MEVMRRVSPEGSPRVVRDGAALAASRAALAVASVKTASFASLVSSTAVKGGLWSNHMLQVLSF